ncbi:hypothetical protein ACTXT7_011269 [Hymenolepis weldensis]
MLQRDSGGDSGLAVVMMQRFETRRNTRREKRAGESNIKSSGEREAQVKEIAINDLPPQPVKAIPKVQHLPARFAFYYEQ